MQTRPFPSFPVPSFPVPSSPVPSFPFAGVAGRARSILIAAIVFSLPSTYVRAEDGGASAGTASAPTSEDARAEVVRTLTRLLQPVFTPASAEAPWWIEAKGRWGRESAEVLLAWDGTGRAILRVDAPWVGSAELGFASARAWLKLPKHGVVFAATYSAPHPLLEDSRLWGVAREQASALLLLARTAPLPRGLTLAREASGSVTAAEGSRWKARLEAGKKGAFSVSLEGPLALEVGVSRLGRSTPAEFAALLESAAAVSPAAANASADAAREESVEADDLRGMAATAVDMVLEKLFWKLQPSLVPPAVPRDLLREGHPVLVLEGTPEEMGRAYGTRLKDAVRINVHRILHGIGLAETVRSGKWFPRSLKETWARQERHVPERFIREMDALADAAGVGRELVRWANVFPERFHCSGLAFRGSVTADGRLLHGRILDYMTEVGFQSMAVITVHVPKGHHAWANVGYVGCIGSVTGMNARSLAMGEMGGRGEGHEDGIPMTFLIREILERFETTEEALAWIRSVPRTCEYFYVISDARTEGMAGVGSWAKSLAAERGIEDLLIIRPGDTHPLLPHGIPDAVLMSAGGRYERLVERVKKHSGKITPEVAWEIMGEGVAMTSALHIALFQPETLDFWVAEASLDGRPAYTQPISKLNLKRILDDAGVARRETRGPAPASAPAPATAVRN